MANRPVPIVLPTQGRAVNDPLQVANTGMNMMQVFAQLAQAKREQEQAQAAEAQRLSLQDLVRQSLTTPGVQQEDVPLGVLPGSTKQYNIPQLSQPSQTPQQRFAIEALAQGGKDMSPDLFKSLLGMVQPETPTPTGADSPFGKIDVSKFTPESVATFERTGKQSDLRVVPGSTASPDNTTFQNEKNLRGEFIKASGDFVKIRDSFNKIRAVADNPSAAGDLSIIFSYMKILDPPSTVREGEQASAANAAGVPERIKNIYNRVLTGERLTPDQRKDFVNQANKLFETSKTSHSKTEKEYRRLAKNYKVNPENVIVDMENDPVVIEKQRLMNKYGLE